MASPDRHDAFAELDAHNFQKAASSSSTPRLYPASPMMATRSAPSFPRSKSRSASRLSASFATPVTPQRPARVSLQGLYRWPEAADDRRNQTRDAAQSGD